MSSPTTNVQNVASTSTKSAFFFYGAGNPNPLVDVQVGWYAQGGTTNILENVPVTRVTNVSGGTAIEIADPNIFVTGESYYFTASVIACFKEDSQILCEVNGIDAYVKVQDIRVGDLVKTHLHGYKKVVVVGNGKIYNNGDDVRVKDRLYKYTKSNYPDLSEDLILTGGHSILVDELSEEQKEHTSKYWKVFHKTDDKYRLLAVVDEKAIPYEEHGMFNIYHITLEHEDENANYGVYANGLLVETCPKRQLKNKKYMTLTE